MKDHKELNKLVVSTLEWYEDNGINPTARELFTAVKSQDNVIVRKGFKSFVKVINQFPDINSTGTNPKSYMRKFKD